MSAEHPKITPIHQDDIAELALGIQELQDSFQRIAKIGKQAYQHSQQTFFRTSMVSDQVEELVEDSEQAALWRARVDEKLATLALSSTAILQQLDAQAVVLQKLTTTLIDGGAFIP